MKRDVQGKFALKNQDYRKVRSLRLTDSSWVALGIVSECLGLTRADYLEQIIQENVLDITVSPGNTRYEEEIKILKTEIQNLTQKNAALLERTAIVELELLRDRILFDLKLGKQAPIYKAVQKALNRFIAKLTQSEKSIF